MRNFDFLQKDWPALAKLAQSAESYIYDDPNSCLIKLGMLAENIVNYIVDASGIIMPNNSTHSDKIHQLKSFNFLPKVIVDSLYALRNARNEAVHANLDSFDKAREMIELAYKLCFWFTATYGRNVLQYTEYVLPPKSFVSVGTNKKTKAEAKAKEIKQKSCTEENQSLAEQEQKLDNACSIEEKASSKSKEIEEESLKLAEQERMLEMLKRREEYLRQKEENERREAEEKRRKEEYERRQREEAERKYQYSLKKTAILNDIKAFHSSLKKDDYFVNDYSQINEDIMTFTRNVNNNIYSNIEGLTNAYNNLINKIKSIKTISQVKAQKRRRNTIVSCLSAIAAVVVFVVLLFEIILPTINYNKAVDLLEQNKYEEAGEIFEGLDDFKDSNEQVIIIDNELKYQNAVNFLNNNQLTEAKQIFVELNGYRDSNEKINAIDLELDYLQALDYYNNKNFSSAKLYFEKTPGYKQTAEYYSSVLNELEYIEATSLFEKRKYSEAQQKFETLNGFRDSNFYAQYINALELESAKKYLEAKEIFIELGSFKDSVLKVSSLNITIANSYSAIRTYLQNNKYNKAVSLAEEIGVSVSYSYNLNGTADSNNLEGYAKIPSKKGYTFISWDTLSYVLNTDEATLTLDLSAEYNIITYNISYVDVRGDYDSTPTTQYTIQESVTLPKIQHAGYIFLGWYENGNRIDNIIQGTIGDITLTAKYEAKQFTISYDFKNGNAQESQLVTYGEEYAVPNPTRVGYSFAGWFNDDIEYEGGIWNATTDKVLIAFWIPNRNIPYKVNRYFQNIEDDNYTLETTEDLIGEADATITPEVKEYEGFTSPIAQTVTLDADGSLMVDYYYVRNYYKISMVVNGGESIPTISQKYQSDITMPIPVRAGYTFGGWFKDINQTDLFNAITPCNNISIYAYWLEENKANDFTYSGTENITILSYEGSSNTMTIPSFIGGVPVEQIYNNAFENQTHILEVEIPNTIKQIGLASFKGCNSIESIKLPFIGASAQAIAFEAVFGYIFGYETEVIYNISSNLQSINFVNVKNEYYKNTTLQYSCYNYKYSESKFCLQTYHYYIPSSIKKVVIAKQERVPIAAFNNCGFIKNIDISKITLIASAAFQQCVLLSTINSDEEGIYELSDSLEKIEENAFLNCYTMKNVIIGEKISSIGVSAFSGCQGLEKITIPDSVTNIGAYAFEKCKAFTNITMPDTVQTIGNCAFKDCANLTNIKISNSLSNFPGSILNGCSMLESIITPSVFQGNRLFGEFFGTNNYEGAIAVEQRRFVKTSASVTTKYTTYYLPATLKNVTLTKGIIREEAFYNCKNLTNVIIEEGVTSVGKGAFGACSSLESITLSFVEKPLSSQENSFYPLGYIFGEYSYDGGEEILQSYRYSSSHIAQTWYCLPKSLKTVIINGESIVYGAFYNCYNIEKVYILNSIKEIDTNAFYGCNSIKEIYYSGTQEQWNEIIIDTNAFYGCNSIKEIYYSVTQEQWNEIIIGDGNSILSIATMYYEQQI